MTLDSIIILCRKTIILFFEKRDFFSFLEALSWIVFFCMTSVKT